MDTLTLWFVTGQSNPAAKALVEDINRLSRAYDNKALLKLDDDPSTAETLATLTEREARGAEVHLEAARIWKAKQNERAVRKLDSAENEINELDMELARGILRKIDYEVLDQGNLDRYNNLLLELEARALELEEIEAGLPELPPGKETPKKWWRR